MLVVAMTFVVVAQVLLLLTPHSGLGWAPWVLLVFSSLLLTYALYRLAQKNPS